MAQQVERQRRWLAQALVSQFQDFRRANGKDKEGERLHHLFFFFLCMYEQHQIGNYLTPTEAMCYSTVLEANKFGADIRIAEKYGYVIRVPNPAYPNAPKRYVLSPGEKLLNFFDERLEELRTISHEIKIPTLV